MKRTSQDTLVDRLNFEWQELRSDPAANALVAGWADRRRAFAVFSTVADIEDAIGGAAPERADDILRSLIRLAARRDEHGALSSRIALQVMLPKVVFIARACTPLLPDPAERQQLAAFRMYEVIRTFPAGDDRRPVAPYLTWHTHRAVLHAIRTQTAEVPIGTQALPAPQSPINPSEELAHLLLWAVSEDVISRRDAQLLASRYGGPGQDTRTWKTIGDLAPIACGSGLSRDAVKQRCSRARRRIVAALPAYPGLVRPDPPRAASPAP